MTNDLVSDMLTRIRNASLARHTFTRVKFNKLNLSVLKVLEAEGYITSFELEAADNKEELKSKLVAEYNEKFSNPDIAAQLGLIDNIIKPSETRKVIIDSFKDLVNKGELGDKHGNIPL